MTKQAKESKSDAEHLLSTFGDDALEQRLAQPDVVDLARRHGRKVDFDEALELGLVIHQPPEECVETSAQVHYLAVRTHQLQVEQQRQAKNRG